jgi:hypothetical protein
VARERKTPEVERSLRQFLSIDGPKGASAEFKRGWEFNFEWSQAEREELNKLMDDMGLTFDEAWDILEGARP